ncbi:MAG: caspase family protein [Rhizobiaceae bacterium]
MAAVAIFAAPARAAVTGLEDAPDPIAAAEAYHAFLKTNAPGTVEPLIDYVDFDMPAPECSPDRRPEVHAILIGASFAGGPFGDLSGPDNDVELLARSLETRGVGSADLVVLAGDKAGRADLREAMLTALLRSGCGDRVIFHFGGNAARPSDLMRAIIPDELRAAADEIPISALWDADFINQEHEATQAIRWAERAGLFLALNQQTDGVLEVLAVSDVADFATAVRNRDADVIVTLDTSYASLADMSGRQEKAGDSDIWSVETSGNPDHRPVYAFAPPLRLQPSHGDFAAFYSSVGDSHSVELAFPNDDGTESVYGVFTLRLAAAIQNRDSVTVRAMAESLKVLPTGDRAAEQRYRVESSNPELVLFGDATLSLPAVEAIVITNPSPKRGAAAIEKPEITIEGAVSWSAPVKAVLVGGKTAAFRGDGTFAHDVQLKPGLNEVEIVALTADGRTHEKRLELVFEGDKKALEGEGRRFALIIANETYDRQRTGFSPLSTPFEDADAVAAILKQRYGFETEATLPGGQAVPLVLRDATRRDIETVLYRIGLVAGEKDTVLIYYAGHGIYEERTTIAFWVPSDAEAGVPISYLSASTISEAIQRMQAGKVIVISDSCFSGALLRGGGDPAQPIDQAARDRALLSLSQKRSRVLISSGNNEPVEDLGGAGHSIFARALLNGLEKMEHDAFSARELFDGWILPTVIANSDQEPQYRPIERTGHEGGDIVFVRK